MNEKNQHRVSIIYNLIVMDLMDGQKEKFYHLHRYVNMDLLPPLNSIFLVNLGSWSYKQTVVSNIVTELGNDNSDVTYEIHLIEKKIYDGFSPRLLVEFTDGFEVSSVKEIEEKVKDYGWTFHYGEHWWKTH